MFSGIQSCSYGGAELMKFGVQLEHERTHTCLCSASVVQLVQWLCYGLEVPDFVYWQGCKNCLFCRNVQTGSGVSPVSC